ncbi:hypothetical protein [Legionella feeleii]|uniref:Uncharacterized protein n=1 Tax=Legionella feeleii TaxID=453 RepID=A0A0W0TUY5_9GAMM|nr:hypothetical protein [Legionella feeleii]KTC99312.1 hypothetical protein Lfee_1375 [Legionella feeleii]SPX59213.1 Uncharacterised protein [Legionella feeleii]
MDDKFVNLSVGYITNITQINLLLVTASSILLISVFKKKEIIATSLTMCACLLSIFSNIATLITNKKLIELSVYSSDYKATVSDAFVYLDLVFYFDVIILILLFISIILGYKSR